MNVLFRNPDAFKAKTFDEAVVKMEKLIELHSGPRHWATNIISATRDLLPEYEEQFIHYLANPSSGTGDLEFSQQMETLTLNEIKANGKHPGIDLDQMQTYKIEKTIGNTAYITVNAAKDTDDEKLQE